MQSPQSLGYRLPAEWEPQEAVWLSWPINRETWPQSWESIQRTFAEIALVLSRYEKVYINLKRDSQPEIESLLREVQSDRGLTRGEIHFFDHLVNDVWVRDHGPIYIKHKQDGTLAVTNWRFNGWGEKHPHELDNDIPALIAEACGLRSFEEPLVLEGGAIETNGVGDLLVTTDCLLHPNRNPGISQQEIESSLKSELGILKVHWLDGCIEGDDTDGHIDNLVRFYKTVGVLIASTEDRENPNFERLSELEYQCRKLQLIGGKRLEIKFLPIPELRLSDGRALPMSYLNFFIANDAVVMPTFGQVEPDTQAREILSEVFPRHEVIGVDCQDLILEGGALHCLTQQVPQAGR